MARDWEFEHNGVNVRIRNSYLHGAKLYVNGDLKDRELSIFATGRTPLLSSGMPDDEILEVYGYSELFSVEFKAFVRSESQATLVFDSKAPHQEFA